MLKLLLVYHRHRLNGISTNMYEHVQGRRSILNIYNIPVLSYCGHIVPQLILIKVYFLLTI